MQLNPKKGCRCKMKDFANIIILTYEFPFHKQQANTKIELPENSST